MAKQKIPARRLWQQMADQGADRKPLVEWRWDPPRWCIVACRFIAGAYLAVGVLVVLWMIFWPLALLAPVALALGWAGRRFPVEAAWTALAMGAVVFLVFLLLLVRDLAITARGCNWRDTLCVFGRQEAEANIAWYISALILTAGAVAVGAATWWRRRPPDAASSGAVR